MKCVDASFTNEDHGLGDNTVLSQEVKAWNNHGAHYIPSVIINQVAYRGVLDPENVYSAICNGYKDPQEECKAYIDDTFKNADKVTFNWFILVIVFLIILNVALLLICKRINQRSMKQEVTDAVNDYMKLRQTNQEMSDK